MSYQILKKEQKEVYAKLQVSGGILNLIPSISLVAII